MCWPVGLKLGQKLKSDCKHGGARTGVVGRPFSRGGVLHYCICLDMHDHGVLVELVEFLFSLPWFYLLVQPHRLFCSFLVALPFLW